MCKVNINQNENIEYCYGHSEAHFNVTPVCPRLSIFFLQKPITADKDYPF